MRLLFELVHLVKKIALQNVGAHRAINFGPEYNKRWVRGEFAPTFRALLISSVGKESAFNVGEWVQSLGWEDLLEEERLPTSVFWPGEFQGVTKSQTTLRLSLFFLTHCLS